MIGNVEQRCVEIGKYIRDTGATVRQAGAVFGISKSTVHIDVAKRLYEIDRLLYGEVKKCLKKIRRKDIFAEELQQRKNTAKRKIFRLI